MVRKVVSLGNRTPVFPNENLVFSTFDLSSRFPKAIEIFGRMNQTLGSGPVPESGGFAGDSRLLGGSSLWF